MFIRIWHANLGLYYILLGILISVNILKNERLSKFHPGGMLIQAQMISFRFRIDLLVFY